MADYTIVNGTDAAFSNVNAGGDDVPARSVRDSITLSDAELAAVCALNGAAVMQDAASYAEKRAVARLLKYRKVVSL